MEKGRINRYIKRGMEGLSIFPNNAKEFGFRMACIQLRRTTSLISVEKYVDEISGYMIKELDDTIKEYNSKVFKFIMPKKDLGGKIPVWVCWLQGENSMPDICHACLNRMRKVLPKKFQLIMLTYDNYLSYIDIPDDIVQKHERGIISAPNYSDIIRFALLSMYGGVWLDATIYLTKDIVSTMLEKEFYTVKFYEENKPIRDASRGKWTGFFCAAYKGSILACFVYDSLIYYWKKHDLAIDYLAVDYVIWAGYAKVLKIKKIIDDVPNNNETFDLLNQMFEKAATKESIELLMHSNGFYKINRHRNYKKETDDGQQTIYSYIVEHN